MQNEVTRVKKWTDIKGLAAIAIENGKKVGTIDDFYYDFHTHTVHSFLIKTGLFSHQILPVSAVNGIGLDALTFTKEEALLKTHEVATASTVLQGKELFSYRILSEGGNVVGTVGNVLFNTADPDTIQVVGFELPGGLREMLSKHYPTFNVNQVTRFGQDVMVIPNDVAQALVP